MAEGRCARLYDPCLGLFLKPVYRAVLETVKTYRCTTILDIGCGTGAQCDLLAAHGFTVVGVDRSEKMLAVARRKKRETVTYLLSDASRTDLPDHYFDCAILSLVIHTNTPAEGDRILAEAHRVVKSEGIYIIVDYGVPSTRKEKMASCMVGALEYFAVEEHKNNYLTYMKLGGIPSFVKRHRLSVVEKHTFYAGALEMVVAQRTITQ